MSADPGGSNGNRTVAGRYRLSERLGGGGMGVVWRAYDERLHRVVAVKQLLLPAELTPAEAEEATQRAMREGRIAAKLQHHNSIMVYDVTEDGGVPYLIMEYLPSSSLSEVLASRGILPPAEVARIGHQVADALASAHAAGVVHRDVKPGNVLLGEDGSVKITDFGISRAVEDATVTRTGIITGTPAYLCPEVAKGQRATFASDVFSLGATLFAAVEGEPPFGTGDNAMALLYRVASAQPAPPTRAGALTGVLGRLLQPDPSRRPTMAQARDELAAAAAGPPGPGLFPPPGPFDPGPPSPVPASAAPTRVGTPTRQLPPIEAAGPAAAFAPPVQPARARTAAAPARGRAGGPRPPTRRPIALVAVTVALLITGAVLLALALADRNGGDGANAPSSAPLDTPQANPSQTATTSAPAAPPSAPAATTTTGDQNQGPGNSRQSREAAITDYYALLPGNTAEGFSRLTAKYQQSPAGGITGYQTFWGQMAAVRASEVMAQGDQVEATITYTFKDGRVIRERHRYTLVEEGGIWKIDESTVLSSRAG